MGMEEEIAKNSNALGSIIHPTEHVSIRSEYTGIKGNNISKLNQSSLQLSNQNQVFVGMSYTQFVLNSPLCVLIFHNVLNCVVIKSNNCIRFLTAMASV